MAYFLKQLLEEVEVPATQLADNLNISLRFPDFSNHNYYINSDKDIDSEFISKCFSFTTQLSDSNSIIMVNFFHIGTRFCLEITFRSSMVKDEIMSTILEKFTQLAPEHIDLNYTIMKNAPISLTLYLKIDS